VLESSQPYPPFCSCNRSSKVCTFQAGYQKILYLYYYQCKKKNTNVDIQGNR
jgi:hypothetical protein